MIYLRKSLLLFTTFMMVLLGTGIGNYAEAASENSTGLSDEESELAEIVAPHIELNQDTGEIILVNENALNEKLSNNNLTNIDEIKQDLANANKNISENSESHNGVITYSMCSNMLSILNIAHTTSLSAAGAILGVNPWLVIGVVSAYGIVWTGAGFACP